MIIWARNANRSISALSESQCFRDAEGGSQTSPELAEFPWTSQKFPGLPQELPGDFPRTSLTVDLKRNSEVLWKLPRLPHKFPGPPQKHHCGRNSYILNSPEFPCCNRCCNDSRLNSCPSAEMCRGFLLYSCLEDFAGDFPGGFFWELFPTQMRRKSLARNPAAQK